MTGALDGEAAAPEGVCSPVLDQGAPASAEEPFETVGPQDSLPEPALDLAAPVMGEEPLAEENAKISSEGFPVAAELKPAAVSEEEGGKEEDEERQAADVATYTPEGMETLDAPHTPTPVPAAVEDAAPAPTQSPPISTIVVGSADGVPTACIDSNAPDTAEEGTSPADVVQVATDVTPVSAGAVGVLHDEEPIAAATTELSAVETGEEAVVPEASAAVEPETVFGGVPPVTPPIGIEEASSVAANDVLPINVVPENKPELSGYVSPDEGSVVADDMPINAVPGSKPELSGYVSPDDGLELAADVLDCTDRDEVAAPATTDEATGDNTAGELSTEAVDIAMPVAAVGSVAALVSDLEDNSSSALNEEASVPGLEEPPQLATSESVPATAFAEVSEAAVSPVHEMASVDTPEASEDTAAAAPTAELEATKAVVEEVPEAEKMDQAAATVVEEVSCH